MVNVSHDSNNWCTFYHSIFVKVIFINKETFDISIVNFFFLGCFNAIVNHQQLNGISIQRLVLSCHNTHHEEFFNDFSWLTFNTFCDFCNRHTLSVFEFFWQFMEFTLGYWFWSRITTVVFTFFIFVFVPVTISLISHLVLIIPLIISCLLRSIFILATIIT